MPDGAFEKTAKGAGEFAAWYARMPELAYRIGTTSLMAKQFVAACERCAGDVKLIDGGISQGQTLDSPPQFTQSIYVDIDGKKAIAIVYCHIPPGDLLSADGAIIASTPEDTFRRYYELVWRHGRWMIQDSRVVV